MRRKVQKDVKNKVEETKVEETKVEETKVEETKVEETKVEETKVEETKVEETKIEETKVEETKVEETKVEETKVEETKVEETKVEETKVEETKVEETKVEETKVEETKVEETTEEVKGEKVTEKDGIGVFDSSDAKGHHKKRGPKPGGKNKTSEEKEKEKGKDSEDIFSDMDKTTMFEIFIDLVENANAGVSSLFYKGEASQYKFPPMLKVALLFVASKQKKFFLNLKFIQEAWFFAVCMILIVIATHVNAIIARKMKTTTEHEKPEQI